MCICRYQQGVESEWLVVVWQAGSEFEGWADSCEKQATDYIIFFEPEEFGSFIHN